jgi:hypothetical protein
MRQLVKTTPMPAGFDPCEGSEQILPIMDTPPFGQHYLFAILVGLSGFVSTKQVMAGMIALSQNTTGSQCPFFCVGVGATYGVASSGIKGG